MDKTKDLKFDIIRIISMLMIILYHYTTRFDELVGHTGYYYGISSNVVTVFVSLFLLMVGYFSYNNINSHKISAQEYLKKRFVRLYPTYLLCLIITSIVILISKFNELSVIQFILNALLINRFFNIDFIDGAYWYMIILIVFTVFATIKKFIEKHIKIDIFNIYTILYLIIGIIQLKFGIVPEIIIYLGFRYINKCLIGYYLFDFKKKNIINIAILSLCEYCFADLSRFCSDTIAIIIFIFVCSIPRLKTNNEITAKIISYLAKKSYFVYLVHEVVGFVFINYFEKIGINVLTSIIITIFIVALLVAFETILTNLIDNIVKRRK